MTTPVVTVFGGTGFIGRHVVRRLARRGVRIRVVTRRADRALYLKPLGDVGQIVPIVSRLGDNAGLVRAIEGADWVVNMVGILTERPGQKFEDVHARLPGRIAAIAKAAGVKRIVHLSSIGAAPDASSAYARSKAAGERALREVFPESTVLRPSVVFGPEDGFFNMLGSISRVAPALPIFFSGLPRIELDGIFPRPNFAKAGATRMQPVYVGDVADAALAALDDPKTAGQTYELGGPAIYSYRGLVELALQVIERHRCLVPVPFFALEAAAFVASAIPFSPLTRDIPRLMKAHNVVGSGALGLADLGVTPTALELVLPTYLHVYRAGRVSRRATQA